MHPLVENILNLAKNPFPDREAFLECNEKCHIMLLEELKRGGINVDKIEHLSNSAYGVKILGLSENLLVQKVENIQTLLNVLKNKDILPNLVGCVVEGLGDKEIVKHYDLYDFLADIYVDLPSREIRIKAHASLVGDSFADSICRHFRMKHLERHKSLILNENIDTRSLLIYPLKSRLNYREVREFLRSIKFHKDYENDSDLIKIFKSKSWQKWAAGDEG